MADQWTIRGKEYGNCNCDWGCPCQFGSPTTRGNCEAVVSGHIEEGHFNGELYTKLPKSLDKCRKSLVEWLCK